MTPKVMVGLPVYQDVSPFFAQYLLKLQANPPCDIEITWNVGGPIAESRNAITARFFRSDCTHLHFIDSDILAEPEQTARLLSHDLDIVSGMYPYKQDGPVEWVGQAHGDKAKREIRDQLHRMQGVGAGFLLIKRAVIETMIGRFGDSIGYLARPDMHTEWDLWQVGIYRYPNGQRYLNEDYYFCQLAQDCGFEVWADVGCVVHHIGRAVYPTQAQLALTPSQK